MTYQRCRCDWESGATLALEMAHMAFRNLIDPYRPYSTAYEIGENERIFNYMQLF